jgi:uncharacterized membrane protein YhaH (DUF805 family)
MLGQFIGFEGRIGRGAWWLSYLLTICLIGFAFLSIGMASKSATSPASMIAISLLSLVCSISAMVVSVCSTVKRYHDRNKSGWWWWIGLVPFLGLWQLIECGFCSGDDGDNNYGPPSGSVERRESLNQEISALSSAASSRLSKLDDNYLATYARDVATKQAAQQMATTPSFATAGPTRPTFGKR